MLYSALVLVVISACAKAEGPSLRIGSDKSPSLLESDIGASNGNEASRALARVVSPIGIDDLSGYEEVAKAFVGLNPIIGVGSGFIIAGDNDIKSEGYPIEAPDSDGVRRNLCTCDCAAGSDGVGCVGWGGIAFRYSSLLWKDPLNGAWTGQIEAYQAVLRDANSVIVERLNFVGSDTRLSPGGHAIYNVACTDSLCDGRISGVFRQSNGPVSCAAGIEDKEAAKGDGTTCFERCANAEAYGEWLDHCNAETPNSGFSGYGI